MCLSEPRDAASPLCAQLGTTPLAWLTGERLALACRLIEQGESRFEIVARRSGLGTAANLRALMRRETGPPIGIPQPVQPAR